MPAIAPADPCLASIVRRNAQRFPDVPAYVAGTAVRTHRELHDRAVALVSALAAIGLRRQDRIAILGRNSIPFGEVIAGAQLGGLILATVNFRLAPPEMGRILADCAPRVLFVDSDYLPVAEKFGPELGIERIIQLDGPEFDEFLAGGTDELPFAAKPDDIACLIYTSGTTGKPKGCILGQREMFRTASTMNVEMRTGSDDRVLLVMPLFHIGAMAIGLGLHARGGTAVPHAAFSPDDLLTTARDEQITVLHLAPTMLQAVLGRVTDHPDALADVRTVVYSAAPMTPPILAAALAAMPDAGFLNLYGQSEVITSGLPRELHRGSGPDEARRLNSVGLPFPDNEVRIVDESGRDLPAGVPGEIVVASPAVFRGYWNDSAATAATLRDGWCHTGDVGTMDADGLIHLVDRKKDVIISGGENVYSLEVEDVLLTHPAVAACAVVGVPDVKWGEAVCAVVVPAPGATIDAGELRDHVRSQIARYKAPRRVVVVGQLPVLSTGKIDKKALRSRYATEETSE